MTPTHVFLAWQNPKSRGILPVGRLRLLDDGLYEFVYVQAVHRAVEQGFGALVCFPELNERYLSLELPPVFSNRVMRRSRPDYPEFIAEMDLREDASPMEIMARTGGRRVTDTYEVFAPPALEADGQLQTQVLARGLRHIPGAEEAILELQPGESLVVVPEPDNARAAYALLLRDAAGRTLGYLPDHLARELARAAGQGSRGGIQVTVTRVNPYPAPLSHRLFCRVQLPNGLSLYADPEYDPIPSDASRVAA